MSKPSIFSNHMKARRVRDRLKDDLKKYEIAKWDLGKWNGGYMVVITIYDDNKEIPLQAPMDGILVQTRIIPAIRKREYV